MLQTKEHITLNPRNIIKAYIEKLTSFADMQALRQILDRNRRDVLVL